MGIPTARVHGAVTGVRAFVFLELVDVAPDGTGTTIDDQVMPVALGDGPVDRRIDLHGIAWLLEPGHVLELEVTHRVDAVRGAPNGPVRRVAHGDRRFPVSPARG